MTVVKTFGVFSFFFVAVLLLGAQNVNAQRTQLDWDGLIDDEASLIIRYRTVVVRTISGQRNGQGHSQWSGRRPRNGRLSAPVNLNRRGGRGRVWVQSSPSALNGWTTVIRISDPRGGPDRYRLRLRWRS